MVNQVMCSANNVLLALLKLNRILVNKTVINSFKIKIKNIDQKESKILTFQVMYMTDMFEIKMITVGIKNPNTIR